MNVEQAIDLIDNLIGMVEDNQNNDYDEALKSAIKALEMSKCNNCDKYDYKTHSCPIFCDVIKHTLDDVKADARTNFLKEICGHEKIMTDAEGKPHFVVKMVDIVKIFNKEHK